MYNKSMKLEFVREMTCVKKILITGGTVFISRYIAEYFVSKNYDVYVLNRNTKEQSKGVKLIQADRHDLGTVLHGIHFDVVIDTAYTSMDVEMILNALESYDDYILISSGAVYSENVLQPFKEDSLVGINKFGGKYGTDKIEAEKILMERSPNAYIIRPPYLYGPMNNVYREAFVFDCALANRKFYLPNTGEMKLQFFHIHDLCRFIKVLLKDKPSQHIFNVGNKDTASVREWVELCYRIVNRQVEFMNVTKAIQQKKYFCFDQYEYYLDVSKQYQLMEDVKPLNEGLEESFEWYLNNLENVNKKNYLEYIDKNF